MKHETYILALNELSEAYEKAELLNDESSMNIISKRMEELVDQNSEFTNEYKLQ